MTLAIHLTVTVSHWIRKPIYSSTSHSYAKLCWL